MPNDAPTIGRVLLWIPDPSHLEGSTAIPTDLSTMFNDKGLFHGQFFYKTTIAPSDFNLYTGVPLVLDVPRDKYGFDHLRFVQKDRHAMQAEHNLSTGLLRVPVNLLSSANAYPAEMLARYFKEQWQFLSTK